MRESGWCAEAYFDRPNDVKLRSLSFGTHPVFVVSTSHLSINLGMPNLPAEITGGPGLTRIRAHVGAARPINHYVEDDRHEMGQRSAFLSGQSFFIAQSAQLVEAVTANAIRRPNSLLRGRRHSIPLF